LPRQKNNATGGFRTTTIGDLHREVQHSKSTLHVCKYLESFGPDFRRFEKMWMFLYHYPHKNVHFANHILPKLSAYNRRTRVAQMALRLGHHLQLQYSILTTHINKKFWPECREVFSLYNFLMAVS
jgi:hypothetical protein